MFSLLNTIINFTQRYQSTPFQALIWLSGRRSTR